MFEKDWREGYYRFSKFRWKKQSSPKCIKNEFKRGNYKKDSQEGCTRKIWRLESWVGELWGIEHFLHEQVEFSCQQNSLAQVFAIFQFSNKPVMRNSENSNFRIIQDLRFSIIRMRVFLKPLECLNIWWLGSHQIKLFIYEYSNNE